jgi:CheY-like chemotaxis protein
MNRSKIPRIAFETIPIAAIPPAALKEIVIAKKIPRRRSHTADAVVSKPKTVKVLVVDDEEAIATSLAQLLDLNGYQCFAAHNSQDALAAAESFTPDVVLCDVIMKGVNGIDTCIRIKKALPACRILLLSGQVPVAHSLMQDAAKSGYNFELLSKPVEPRALVAKIENLFTGAHSAVRAN